MKTVLILAAFVFVMAGCAAPRGQGGIGSDAGTLRETGTTGMGAGSDTTTRTGIDSGTRSGSSIPPL
ncbi:MAG: hypothetical protein ACTHLW_01575 [Verrucomicrobiota bacterium]